MFIEKQYKSSIVGTEKCSTQFSGLKHAFKMENTTHEWHMAWLRLYEEFFQHKIRNIPFCLLHAFDNMLMTE